MFATSKGRPIRERYVIHMYKHTMKTYTANSITSTENSATKDYLRKWKKGAVMGQKVEGQRKPTKPKKPKPLFLKPKKADNVNDNVNVNVTANVNEIKRDKSLMVDGGGSFLHGCI
jgi:hypothetical protein